MNEIENIDCKEIVSTMIEENCCGFPHSPQGEGMSENPEEGHSEHVDESHDDGASAEHSTYLDGLMQELKDLPTAESKLQKVITFMEEALAQTGRPHFKSFWQARGLCLQFFKDDSISPTSRTDLWNKYTELSKTARRLKTHFDEQSAFAVEQIEIAINALDTELAQLEQNPDQIPTHDISIQCQALDAHLAIYQREQGELDQLNSKAARINSLRKELINTGMPSRKKNKFFHRLSQLGDRVFPRRKELIQKLSERFSNDVDAFVKSNFTGDKVQGQLFVMREEIKALQAIAKQLTLNTQTFTNTRMSLSQCWDKIKVLDKERKKERTQQKSVLKDNEDAVKAKIDECRQALEGSQHSPGEALKKIDEVAVFMRQTLLGRVEVKMLRDQLDALRQPFLDQLKAADQRRHDQEIERQQQRERNINEMKSSIEHLLHNSEKMNMDQFVAERDALTEKIQSAQISRAEKMEFERLMKPLRDVLLEKKADALKKMPENDRQALEQLGELLTEKKELRQEVKDQLETLRRAVGSSGLDFEKALEYNGQIGAQKERLEKINLGIQELEEQIEELEEKLY